MWYITVFKTIMPCNSHGVLECDEYYKNSAVNVIYLDFNAKNK